VRGRRQATHASDQRRYRSEVGQILGDECRASSTNVPVKRGGNIRHGSGCDQRPRNVRSPHRSADRFPHHILNGQRDAGVIEAIDHPRSTNRTVLTLLIEESVQLRIANRKEIPEEMHLSPPDPYGKFTARNNANVMRVSRLCRGGNPGQRIVVGERERPYAYRGSVCYDPGGVDLTVRSRRVHMEINELHAFGNCP
jgi:hypothetical protein